MKKIVILTSATIIILARLTNLSAEETKDKSNHKITGSIDLSYRTNSNIGAAPSSNSGFDFSNFDDEEDAEEDSDEVDVDFDEDALEELDSTDEDLDGVDDLLDANADSTVDSENRFSTKLGIKYKYTFNKDDSWSSALKAVDDIHDRREDLDKINWAITTGPEIKLGNYDLKIKPSISYLMLQKDNGGDFLDTWVGSLVFEYEASKYLTLTAAYNYQDKDIILPSSPDATVDTLKFGAEYKITKNDVVKMSLSPKFEDSTKVTRNKDSYGSEFTYSRKLPSEMRVDFGIKYNNTDYKNLSPNREDSTFTYGVYLSKEFRKSFSVTLGLETKDRNSNIVGKDAKNNSLIFSTGWKF